ncbi:unnamed protein product [Cladocopium goreaui]|uniref:Uncharacterized protein n=1 Tax=Cladocopium goreaui TaxID=2562237 RepID=A0A9P1DV68_9DINO|nr:unnamed protein product [Cladocopium goreaui]
MDGTTIVILLFVMLCVGGVGAYVYYVNMKMEEAGMGQKNISGKKKIRKKDKTSWSING